MDLHDINKAMGTDFKSREEFIDVTYRMVSLLGKDLVKNLNPSIRSRVKDGLETMRDHYVTLEKYEYCAKIKEIIDALDSET